MRIVLSSTQKKIVHSVMVVLVTFGTDIGTQMMTGTVNITRSAIVGIVVGFLARIIGAVLAATAMPNE